MDPKLTVQCLSRPARSATFADFGEVCRLGLATRGNTHLEPEDVLEAIERGVNFLNWCGHADGLSAAVRRLDARSRSGVCVCVQLGARDEKAASREFEEILGELGTPYVDAVTYYYVERQEEWEAIQSSGGAAEALEKERREGRLRHIGLTSHQRPLAARLATTGKLDFLMVRYNAAHRGAEREVFPTTTELGLPVVTYTGLRWGALLEPTPDTPPEFSLPSAPDCYRFVLCHPAVSVGLMAPDGRRELEENLQILEDWRGFPLQEYEALCKHGDRVRRHAGSFP